MSAPFDQQKASHYSELNYIEIYRLSFLLGTSSEPGLRPGEANATKEILIVFNFNLRLLIFQGSNYSFPEKIRFFSFSTFFREITGHLSVTPCIK